jgi:hypothetical protein
MERRARETGDHDVSLHRTSPLAERAAAGRGTFSLCGHMGNPSIEIDQRAIVRAHD